MNMSSLAVIKTPAGAASSAAGMISLIINVILPPVWPWLAHQSQTWRGGVVTVLIFAASYAGAYWKVVRANGQKLTLSLTSSPFPTIKAEESQPIAR